MGRVYTASSDIAGFTTGDIVEINAPSDAIVKVYSFSISQSTSETDDSAAIRVSRFVTSGSGGGVITASPLEVGDAAFGGTIEEANGTIASGTETILLSQGISMLAGLSKIWVPEMRPILAPSGRLVITTSSTVTSVTLNWSVEFEEIG